MNDQPAHLDLFSGIGGFAIAFGSEGFRTIGHAEVDSFACAVYHRRFPNSVCFGGVQNVTRSSVIERCGILPFVVTGGFPCQPHSQAGKRRASEDERDLWGECNRTLGDIRPRFALFENVSGLFTSERGLFLNRVLSDLAEIRFACVWGVIPAAAVRAPHRRDRIWLLCINQDVAVGQANGDMRGRLHGEPKIITGNAGLNAQRDSTPRGKSFVGVGQADSHEAGRRELRRCLPIRAQQPAAKCCGVGQANTNCGGRNEDWKPGELRTTWPEQSPCDSGQANQSQENQIWPASEGLWPSRPGEQQFGWEPPRTVGGRVGSPTRELQQGRGTSPEEAGSAEHPNASDCGRKEMGDSAGPRCEWLAWTGEPFKGELQPQPAGRGDREAESSLGGMSDGLSTIVGGTWPQVFNRSGQLKGFGNAIVPQVAQIFARAIKKLI